MRIAYICVDPGIPIFGTKGASVHVQEVIRELRKAGHDVHVYATRVGTDVPADLQDIPVTRFKLGTKEPEARENAQIQASADIVAALTDDGAEFVYERYSLFSTALADSGLPGILEVNAPLIDEQRTHRVLINDLAAQRALQVQVRAARAVICVSEAAANWVRASVPNTDNVHAIANGVNTDRIRPQPETPGVPVVTFVGTLKPWHGTEYLIRAAAHAQQQWRLRIIGDGPEREHLEFLARGLGLEVDFCGAVPPEDMSAQLAGSAVGVAPYPAPKTNDAHYFSPLKVYEYLAAGLPVVATRVGQVPGALGGVVKQEDSDHLEVREAGVIVEGSSPEALAQAIDYLVTDAHLRATTGARARELAVSQHSWAGVVSQMWELAHG